MANVISNNVGTSIPSPFNPRTITGGSMLGTQPTTTQTTSPSVAAPPPKFPSLITPIPSAPVVGGTQQATGYVGSPTGVLAPSTPTPTTGLLGGSSATPAPSVAATTPPVPPLSSTQTAPTTPPAPVAPAPTPTPEELAYQKYVSDSQAYAQTQKAINGLGATGGLSPAVTGLSEEVANANTPLLQADLNATGLAANQPAGFGQTSFSPITGTFANGATNGNNLDPQTYAGTLADQVIAGTLPYPQAQSLMGYAGSAGSAFLQKAIQAKNPTFNFGQAAENSAAQGTIGPQAATATEAINQLQSAMQSAPWYQTTGIPAINAISGLLSTVGLGTGSQANINDARNEAVQTATSVLGTAYSSAGQVTPTSLTSLVQSWFPPNPTPSQVQAGIQQFNQRLASITSSFTSPGTVPLPSAGTNTGSVNYNF